MHPAPRVAHWNSAPDIPFALPTTGIFLHLLLRPSSRGWGICALNRKCACYLKVVVRCRSPALNRCLINVCTTKLDWINHKGTIKDSQCSTDHRLNPSEIWTIFVVGEATLWFTWFRSRFRLFFKSCLFMCSFTISNNWKQWKWVFGEPSVMKEMTVIGTRSKFTGHKLLNPHLGMCAEIWKKKIGINCIHLSFLRLQSIYTGMILIIRSFQLYRFSIQSKEHKTLRRKSTTSPSIQSLHFTLC